MTKSTLVVAGDSSDGSGQPSLPALASTQIGRACARARRLGQEEDAYDRRVRVRAEAEQRRERAYERGRINARTRLRKQYVDAVHAARTDML